MADTLKDYGQADLLQERLGLNPTVGLKIAAIITFASGIEHFLERALWTLRGTNVAGVQPDTDAKQITSLIDMLNAFATAAPEGNGRRLLEDWCAAARAGFLIRHNIAHGVPVQMGEVLAYMRNPRWHGEVRKREFGDFWADDNSLDMVREAMAVLLRVVSSLCRDNAMLDDVASPIALKAVRTARSVLGEFSTRAYNPSFEKY